MLVMCVDKGGTSASLKSVESLQTAIFPSRSLQSKRLLHDIQLWIVFVYGANRIAVLLEKSCL